MSFFVFNEGHTKKILKNIIALTRNGLNYDFLVNLPISLFQTVIDINNELETDDAEEPEKIEGDPKSIGQQFPGMFNI